MCHNVKNKAINLFYRKKTITLCVTIHIYSFIMTKRRFLSLFCALLCVCTLSAQKKFGLYCVGFYNLENLFDTTHDEGKNDYEFLPSGSYAWDENKYSNKLRNMSRVLADMGTDKLPGIGAAVIGVSEVENAHVMDDLVAQPALSERGMKYVHIEGPDHRGVDCALVYNPKLFTPEKSFLQPYVYDKPEDAKRATRGFLTVQGTMGGDKLTVIVCHWPSRGATGYYRELAGKQVRALTDSIQAADPTQHIIVMGDMNDDPDNLSMSKELGARRKIKDMKPGDFYNPWWDILRKRGQGTLSYQGAWNLFDQIVLSESLVKGMSGKDYSGLTLYAWHIFTRDYLINQDGKYKGTPKRTTSRGAWLNGFSDHLPTVTYLIKEIK